MKTRGMKWLDPMLHTRQLDWLVFSLHDCPDSDAERHVISAYFRLPHEPWGAGRAFVQPVKVRRTRRRVLLRQESGVGL